MKEIVFRNLDVNTDLPFIFSTWLRSFKFNSEGFAKLISSDIYYKYHQKVIDRILSRNPATIIACSKEDPGTIFGYIITEFTVLHFAYVKKQFRNLGIGKDLLSKAGSIEFVSHLTKDSKKFLEKNPGIKYNPYLT